MIPITQVASAVRRLLGDPAPVPLPPLPGASEAFECVVIETPLRIGPLRVDVMGAVRSEREPTSEGARGRSALPPGIPLAWLEWDVPYPGVVVGPLRFHCVTDAILGAGAAERPPTDADELRRWVRDVVRSVAPSRSSAWDTGVSRLLDALPGGVVLAHVASLEPRGTKRLRLVFTLRAGAATSWLAEVQWPGDVAEVGRVLDRVVPPSRWMGIQLELSPELSPELGIELPQIRDMDTARGDGARYLREAASLCSCPTDSAGAALSQWVAGQPALSFDAIRFGYVKLCRDEREWAAKLYLGAETPHVAEEMSRAARAHLERRGGARPGMIGSWFER